MNSILLVGMCFFALIFNERVSAQVDTATPSRVNPAEVILPRLTQNQNTPSVFATALRAAELSGGMVALNKDCTHSAKKNWSIEEGTRLNQVLDEISSNIGSSKWEINDGVVNVVPVKIPPILQVRVSNFEWNKTGSIKEAIAKVRSLAESSVEAHAAGVKAGAYEGTASAICIRSNCPQPAKPVSEVADGITVLTLLNRIVREHRGATWIYSEYRCNNEVHFTLNALSE